MRLLPLFSLLSRAALSAYYRLEIAGAVVPEAGPVLLVANHPNSLLDPAAVCAAARRPVRFLAKAPLFEDRLVGWLVRSCGSIPVYRRQDDPSLMDRNEDAFRAAFASLAAGDAVGIFPEGRSHSEPRLGEMRTGAARIALGAASRSGRGFPIVPVGLVLREKERFRSRALILVGEPVEWEDLAGRGAGDVESMRELTRRIEASLRGVTVSLERWEDAPAVETAEAIYAAEQTLPEDPELRIRRLGQVSEALSHARRAGPERVRPLYRAVLRYGELLSSLRLRPEALPAVAPGPGAASRWLLGRLAFFLLATPLALAGAILFFPPYRVVALVVRFSRTPKDVESTLKLLVGVLVYGAWILALALLCGLWLGPRAGLLAVPALPALGLLALFVRERWADAVSEARRYLALRRRPDISTRLLRQRAELGARLEALRSELAGEEAGRPESRDSLF